MSHIDPETARRVNAVTLDVMSAFRNTVELYYATPELVTTAGFTSFADWARGQPRPQLDREERKQLAITYTEDLGMTQREAAAALGVDHRTVGRDVGANAPPQPEDERDVGANAPPQPEVEPGDPDTDTVDMTPDPTDLNRWYVKALSEYIAGIVNVTPPALGQPTLMRRRRELERALQATLNAFASRG